MLRQRKFEAVQQNGHQGIGENIRARPFYRDWKLLNVIGEGLPETVLGQVAELMNGAYAYGMLDATGQWPEEEK